MSNFPIFGKNGNMKHRFICLFPFLSLFCALNAIQAQTNFHSSASDLQPGKPFENVLVQKLYSDPHASGFVIWIKQQVPPHKHESHSETVFVLDGKGEMRLGDQMRIVRKGDILFIPQGTPHAVKVTKGVLKVLSIQAPEFDGTDRVPLEN